jgi:hypothetical protein
VIDVDLLRERVRATRVALDEAAARGGRPPGSVELLVAGKYVSAEEAPALADAGVTLVGENRLQDLQAKRAVIGDRVTFDFIGHLQRRKVRDVLPAVRLIHALDSERLAREIVSRAGGPTRLLVELNVAEEETKGGILPGNLDAFVEEVSAMSELTVGGLMVMPPAHTDPERSRPYFARARETASRLAERWAGRHDFRDLSMGTSQDHLVAAEEGATIVRVGRGLIEPTRVGG